MKVKTLAKIALGLTFPLAGMAFLTQNKISSNFHIFVYRLELKKKKKTRTKQLIRNVIEKNKGVSRILEFVFFLVDDV